jgi:2,3-bisphosphoglycerate-independent phosphoglycerate mutase
MNNQTVVPRRPVVLVIMDGVGINPSKLNNAVAAARTPRLDEYYFRYPFTVLSASGPAVGLPEGQMGNSEVGHMTLGSGCVVRQDLVLINDAIADGSFATNPALSKSVATAKRLGRPLHLFGLVSDGGVHSHLGHLIALVEMCRRAGVEPVVHMVTDGRDTAPQSALEYLTTLEQALGRGAGRIATLSGRFYAMDRDRRWDRTERAWRALVLGKGRGAATARDAINAAYAAGENDEFIQPTVIGGFRGLADDDVVFSFNFRKDRPRQMVAALADPEFDGFDRGRYPQLDLTCMMQYDRDLPLPFAFAPETPGAALNRILGERGVAQFHCAETEKYAHVTFFFNGGSQDLEPGEEHRLIPSPKVATYDLKPEMSAPQVADATVEAIRSGRFGFLVVNFANGDMVGHTGDQSAAIRAVEALDRAVGRVLDAAVEHGYSALVTADHGNCDLMVDPETDEPHTQHTMSPVPLMVVDESRWTLAGSGSLADVAPTVLELMGLPKPAGMTGRSMLVEELQPKPNPVVERLYAA